MTEIQQRIGQLADSAAAEPMPDDLAKWLTQLENLVGVPFNYLVPDIAMLPPETLRFFHIDPNWINALVDGATSIGRHFETPNAYAFVQHAEHANLMAARSQTTEMKHLVRQVQLSKIPARDIAWKGHDLARCALSEPAG